MMMQGMRILDHHHLRTLVAEEHHGILTGTAVFVVTG
jgi:hypothetical protein